MLRYCSAIFQYLIQDVSGTLFLFEDKVISLLAAYRNKTGG